jgi:hypothetical protein
MKSHISCVPLAVSPTLETTVCACFLPLARHTRHKMDKMSRLLSYRKRF